MSLSYSFPHVLEMTVMCHRCGQKEKKFLPESIPMEELNNHLCNDCQNLAESEAADDHLTFQKFYDRVTEEAGGVHFPIAYIDIWWRDYIDQNLNGKMLCSDEFIRQLNLRDGK